MNNTYQNKNSKKIIITTGDPAGIGTEIILKALDKIESNLSKNIVLIGCKKNIYNTYDHLISKSCKDIINPKDIEIIDMAMNTNVQFGKSSPDCGNASFNFLKRSINLVLNNQFRGLVTGPISKYSWHQANHIYDGQTELLAEVSKSNKPSMLFTAISPKSRWRFNTLLATTHIPLSEVPIKLNPDLIKSKLDALFEFCNKFNSQPKLLVAGINPHAGEGGKIGKDEENWLIPTLNEWRKKNPTAILSDPIPPDTCWLLASKLWNNNNHKTYESLDGILGMYHDQALIPTKLIAFDYAVNTTLGIPFIRTSPDHGTAFDIAGKGIANPQSMIEAIKTAFELT